MKNKKLLSILTLSLKSLAASNELNENVMGEELSVEELIKQLKNFDADEKEHKDTAQLKNTSSRQNF